MEKISGQATWSDLQLRRSLLAAGVLLSPWLLSTGKAAPVVKVGGTGSALATIHRLSEEFSRSAGGTTIQVLPSLGTAGGIRALQAGVIQLAVAARPLKEVETAAGLSGREYARTPLVFTTSPGVGLTSVTRGEVVRIYNGEMTTWPNGTPVRLVRRPPTEAEWEALSALSPAMASAVISALKRPGLVTAASDQDNADAIERMNGGFGLMALGQILSEQRNVKALALDGLVATPAVLEDGKWPIVKTLHLITPANPLAEVRDFVAFVLSAQSASLLSELGHLPLAQKS